MIVNQSNGTIIYIAPLACAESFLSDSFFFKKNYLDDLNVLDLKNRV